MLWHKKTFLTWCLMIGLVMLPLFTSAAPVNSSAQPVAPPEATSSSTEKMGVDALVVRPLGLVSTIGGSVLFILSSPFSAVGGNIDEAWDLLVAEPARYTFKRPLGHFEEDIEEE